MTASNASMDVAAPAWVQNPKLVAWVQVLVYVGAVVVLMLFAVMLTRAPMRGEELTEPPLVRRAGITTRRSSLRRAANP